MNVVFRATLLALAIIAMTLALVNPATADNYVPWSYGTDVEGQTL